MWLLCSVALASPQEPIVLAPLFQDHGVLQRNALVPVWGETTPKASVVIKGSWGATAKTQADSNGHFMAKLGTSGAGGPYTLTVTSGDKSKTLEDILLGEVWLCSGQSNMEMPMGGWGQPLKNGLYNLEHANRPKIRIFNVPNVMLGEPSKTCGGQWDAATPETVKTFSAAGFHFGSYLQDALNVPIGLIDSTWGGTEVELWTSESALLANKVLGPSAQKFKALGDPNGDKAKLRKQRLAEDLEHASTYPKDEASDWTAIDRPEAFKDDFDGSMWYRAEVEIPAGMAGTEAHLTLGAIDDEDITWVNGTEVGRNTLWNAERNYTVKAEVLKEGKNTITVRAFDSLGGGGFTAPDKIGLQIGSQTLKLEHWKVKMGADISGLPAPGTGFKMSALYNGMIAPLVPYAIKGAVWYQGEANVGRAFQYRTAMPLMIQDWRHQWGKDFPFYLVQIAPFQYGAQGRSAELRDAQDYTVRHTPGTGMVCTVDLVDNLADIHPLDKQSVGERLSRLALRRTYGFRNIADRGPTYLGYSKQGNTIKIKFSDAQGLNLRGAPAGIMIAGADMNFRPADAKVEGQSLVVWASGLNDPVAVRFGWGDAVVTNLFNGAGLPAPPFRTDDLPLLTRDEKW